MWPLTRVDIIQISPSQDGQLVLTILNLQYRLRVTSGQTSYHRHHPTQMDYRRRISQRLVLAMMVGVMATESGVTPQSLGLGVCFCECSVIGKSLESKREIPRWDLYLYTMLSVKVIRVTM